MKISDSNVKVRNYMDKNRMQTNIKKGKPDTRQNVELQTKKMSVIVLIVVSDRMWQRIYITGLGENDVDWDMTMAVMWLPM